MSDQTKVNETSRAEGESRLNDGLAAKQRVKEARIYLNEHNPHMANYVLRDLEIIKGTDLYDFSWCCHNETCNSKDIEFLMEGIEKLLAANV